MSMLINHQWRGLSQAGKVVAGIGAVLLFSTLATAQGGKAAAKGGADASGGSAQGATPTHIDFNVSGGCLAKADAKKIKSTAELVAEYDDGARWDQLQKDLIDVLATCELRDSAGNVVLGFGRNLKKGPKELAGAETVLVTLVSGSKLYYVVLPQVQPYSLVIAGQTRVVPVLLLDIAAKGDKAPTDFKFVSTRIQDPRLAQIPAFIKQLAAAVQFLEFKSIEDPQLWVYGIQEVQLPFKRASIVESGTLAVKCDDGSGLLAKCDKTTDKTIDLQISVTYANTPRTRVDFTAMAGSVVGPYRGYEKMKVDGGKFASDPPKHAMTMAAIAWHFRAYDSSLPDISMAERWSVLLGGVLTPNAGIGAGISFGFIRGFALNAGELVMWVPTSADGSAVGTTAPTGTSQLAHKYSYGTFIGGNYTFGGGN